MKYSTNRNTEKSVKIPIFRQNHIKRGNGEVFLGGNNTVMVEEGGSLGLRCSTPSDWFLCLWTLPSGEKECSIKEKSSVKTVCGQKSDNNF